MDDEVLTLSGENHELSQEVFSYPVDPRIYIGESQPQAATFCVMFCSFYIPCLSQPF